MAINRRHFIAPLAIGAVALSLAGTGAALAATGTHAVRPPGAVTLTTTTAADLRADRHGREVTRDVASTDATSEAATTPLKDTTRDAVGSASTHDAVRTDRAGAGDR